MDDSGGSLKASAPGCPELCRKFQIVQNGCNRRGGNTAPSLPWCKVLLLHCDVGKIMKMGVGRGQSCQEDKMQDAKISKRMRRFSKQTALELSDSRAT